MAPDLGSGQDWLTAVARLREQRRAGVVVTVVAVRGHAPREAGAKMVVSARPGVGHGGRWKPRGHGHRAGATSCSARPPASPSW